VAENHGLLNDEIPDATMQPVVDIRAADARVRDADDDGVGVGPERWNRAVFEGDMVGGLEDKGEVLQAGILVNSGPDSRNKSNLGAYFWMASAGHLDRLRF
jgi:hypothetical protein